MLFVSVLIYLVLFVLSVKFVKTWLNERARWYHFWKIPGPTTYPLIGNTHYLLQSRENIFRAERKSAIDFYPIYKISAFSLRSVYFLSPEDIEQLLTNMKHISKSIFYKFLHDWLGTGLLTSTGTKWQHRRKILTPAFHFNILQDFVTIFNTETTNLIKEIRRGIHADGVLDVVPPITQFTLQSIRETALGLNALDEWSYDMKNRYKEAIYRIGELVVNRVVQPWIYNDYVYNKTATGREAKVIVTNLHNYSKTVIEQRKKLLGKNHEKPRESYSSRKRTAMLDLLLNYKANGAQIDDEGIREEVDTFMFEGHDTTSMAICYILMVLANHRECQDKILLEINEILGTTEEPTYQHLQNMKYLERCLKECLRLYPSVPFISRIAGEDIHTHSGYIIPAKCIVNVSIYDLHRNPTIYPDPETFDPDRFLPENCAKRHPFAYLPFSAGPRNCIGQKFALLELKTVVVGILRNFQLEAVDRPEDLVFISDLVLRTANGVKVKFVNRKIE